MASTRAVGWIALLAILGGIAATTYFVLQGGTTDDVPDFDSTKPPPVTETASRPRAATDPQPSRPGPSIPAAPRPAAGTNTNANAAAPRGADPVAGGGVPTPAPDYGPLDERQLSTIAPTFFGVVSGPEGRLGGAEVVLWHEMPMPFGYRRVAALRTDAKGQFIVDPSRLAQDKRYHVQITYPGLVSRFYWNCSRGKQFTAGLTQGQPLRGLVRDTKEQPVAGIEVIAQGKTWREATETDAEGRFTFEHAPSGALRVEARSPRHQPFALNDATAGDTEWTLTVESGPRVVGTVFDGVTNEPLAGVTIATGIPGNDGRIAKAQTDEEGNYTIPGMPATFVTFFAALDGYSEGMKNTKLTTDKEEFRYDFKLFPLGAIRGRVVDNGGAGIAGARIFLAAKNNFFHHVLDTETPSAVTDESGTFFLQNVKTNPGYDTRLVADHPRFMRGESGVLRPTPGKIVEGVSIRLEKGLPFGGRVVSKVTGRGVAGASVKFQAFGAQRQLTVFFGQGPAQPLSVRTDENGEFLVEQLQKGRVKIEVEADGHLSFQEMVDVAEQGVRGKVIELSEGFAIEGRVVDVQGRGISNVRIHAACGQPVNSFSNATTNQEGYFKVKNLKRGNYDVSARIVGYEEQQKKGIQVGEKDLRFTMLPNGRILGTVTASRGGGLKEFTVNLQRLDEKGQWQWYRDFPHRQPKQPVKNPRPPGSYTCSDVRPGTYKVTIRNKEHADAERTGVVVMSGADAQNIDFVLSAGNTVFGRLTDANGLVPGGGHVTAQPLDPAGKPDRLTPARTARVKEDGTYRIKGLKAGAYDIKPMAGGYCQARGERVTLGGDREFNITLVVNKGGTLRVRVLDAQSQPLGGAEITVTDSSGTRFGATVDSQDPRARMLGKTAAAGDLAGSGDGDEGGSGTMSRTNLSGELVLAQPMCPGPATLVVSAPGYPKVTKTIQIVDEREAIETVRLRR